MGWGGRQGSSSTLWICEPLFGLVAVCHVGILVAKCLSKFFAHFPFAPSFPMFCCRSVAQPCLTLWNPVDCSLPGFSVHGIFQARTLERIAIPFSRGSSQSRERTCVSYMAGGFFATEPPGKPFPMFRSSFLWKFYIIIFLTVPLSI